MSGVVRPLFIGEAPSRSTARPGGAPLVGESGARLAAWAGLSRAEFRRRAECVNLFNALPVRWSRRDARDAARLLPPVGGRRFVVLLGGKVVDAFRLSAAGWPEFTPHPRSPLGVQTYWMPHPSGLNRYWNSPTHVRWAETFLRMVMDVKVQQAYAVPLAPWRWRDGTDDDEAD